MVQSELRALSHAGVFEYHHRSSHTPLGTSDRYRPSSSAQRSTPGNTEQAPEHDRCYTIVELFLFVTRSV
jgi:hypothetical protein